MRAFAVVLFLGGLFLAVRVMFFGVQRRTAEEELHHRRGPLALAAFQVVCGAMLYLRATEGTVTARWVALVVFSGGAAGAAAWWLVQHSAGIPSSDPEDDPRYRYQGHVARVIQPIGPNRSGRITFSFDGKRHELVARWSTENGEHRELGAAESEVVIERIEDEVAFVEPWTVVEGRL